MSETLLQEIGDEANRAAVRYGPMMSTHEALGVLCEEWDELREAIHANDLERVRREAIQVAAVAIRLALACRDDHAFRLRSGAGS